MPGTTTSHLTAPWAPRFLLSEKKHLSRARYSDLRRLLRQAGYRTVDLWPDGLASRDPPRDWGRRDRLWKRIFVRIRLRVDSDVHKCVRIAEQVHLLDGYPVYVPNDLEDFVASPDALVAWVAEEDGEILGHVALHAHSSNAVLALASESLGQSSDRFGVVARLLVAPDARRRGIGRSLLGTAAMECVQRGLRPILDVVTEHAQAISLYEGEGWSRAGQVTVTLGDGKEIQEIVFLGPPPSGVQQPRVLPG
jgi:GNAT superfamily N-acetyltransferase